VHDGHPPHIVLDDLHIRRLGDVVAGVLLIVFRLKRRVVAEYLRIQALSNPFRP
jgi:hypothetical protein